MKVLIELPDNWLDTDLTDNIQWMTRTVHEEVKRQLVKSLVEQVDLPKLEFTAEEMLPLVAKALADRKADELWEK